MAVIQSVTQTYYQPAPPNRDDALEIVYNFLKAVAEKDTVRAESFLAVADMSRFLDLLNMSFQKYLDMVVEDEQWEDFRNRDIATEVTDPHLMDEDLTLPEFSGKQFVLSPEETVSVKLALRGQITPIRLHFSVVKSEEGYHLKLYRLTA
ncbi:MAG: hypothetical protein M3Q97_04430 [Bacteroidota bacterium]|nr:hypothetical protein [Bacteroidota bacterium]